MKTKLRSRNWLSPRKEIPFPKLPISRKGISIPLGKPKNSDLFLLGPAPHQAPPGRLADLPPPLIGHWPHLSVPRQLKEEDPSQSALAHDMPPVAGELVPPPRLPLSSQDHPPSSCPSTKSMSISLVPTVYHESTSSVPFYFPFNQNTALAVIQWLIPPSNQVLFMFYMNNFIKQNLCFSITESHLFSSKPNWNPTFPETFVLHKYLSL